MDLYEKLRKKDLLLPFGYVNNKLVKKSSSGSSFDVVDPGSGALVAVLPNLGVKETKLAIESASRAFDSYSKTTAKVYITTCRKFDACSKLVCAPPEQSKPVFSKLT